MKKKLFYMVLFLALLFLAIIICYRFFCNNDNSGTLDDSAKATPASSANADDFFSFPALVAQGNSMEMIERIEEAAKERVSKMTDDNAVEIIEMIKVQSPEFYTDNAAMEVCMWLGRLLEYYFPAGDPRGKLGADVEQAVRCVYLREKKESDAATKKKLRQIEKDIAAIYESGLVSSK